MAQHPSRAKPPIHCAYCGKPGHKKIEVIRNPAVSAATQVERDALSATRESWRYVGNQIVLRSIWRKPGEWGSNNERFLLEVSVWDGETWELAYNPFCRLECARLFGFAAYRAGLRMKPLQREAA